MESSHESDAKSIYFKTVLCKDYSCYLILICANIH